MRLLDASQLQPPPDIELPRKWENSYGNEKESGKEGGKEKHREKKSTRKYSPTAQSSVEREMRAMKKGQLKSGRSGKKVTNPKQAVAIGLSEARKKGAKVPAKKKSP